MMTNDKSDLSEENGTKLIGILFILKKKIKKEKVMEVRFVHGGCVILFPYTEAIVIVHDGVGLQPFAN
jgi:hypothetical protein